MKYLFALVVVLIVAATGLEFEGYGNDVVWFITGVAVIGFIVEIISEGSV